MKRDSCVILTDPSVRVRKMHENMEEDERKIVNEFCHLLEKSKQLFNGLRDMPQYGHKQWQARIF